MSIILDVVEQDEFPNYLDIFTPDTRLEKAALRKQLEEDIKVFINNGGDVTHVETKITPDRCFKVGFNKEGSGGFFNDND